MIEDDHGDAFLVSELLREEGAPVDVCRAQSLTEGLDLLRAERFDCVLLDLGLPDASGLAALKRRRTSRTSCSPATATTSAASRRSRPAPRTTS
jgi:DNA-binding response OmpR family regulator